MKLENIDVESTIENARHLLDEDQNVSPALKSSIEVLLLLVVLLLNRLDRNSSKPPSSDPNWKKKKEKKKKEPGSKRPADKRGIMVPP